MVGGSEEMQLCWRCSTSSCVSAITASGTCARRLLHSAPPSQVSPTPP
jgi:hypothetical protein